MFDTDVGALKQATERISFRPEIAQRICTKCENALDSTWDEMPFGIAQIGKSFRNEAHDDISFSVHANLWRWKCHFASMIETNLHRSGTNVGSMNPSIGNRSLELPNDMLGFYMHQKDKLVFTVETCMDITT
jgi:glycyl-tRNA synthetase